MNTNHALSLLALAASAAFSTCALAQSQPSGTVNFEGSILDVTCTPTLGGPSTSGQTVTLPSVPVSDLATAASVTGETEFEFNMTDCVINPTSTQVWFHFGGSNVNSNGRLATTSGTNKVSFQLLDGPGGAAITAGGTAPANTTAPGAGKVCGPVLRRTGTGRR